jgi:hypothetical protein
MEKSDKGENLPSATYYYVIELNKGETKGWIYLIRENSKLIYFEHHE